METDPKIPPYVLASIERLLIGERIQRGDWWYYRSIGCWFQMGDPPRNWLGLRQKITARHAPFYRVTGLQNPLLDQADPRRPDL